mmetsp:Transcript_38104/g.93198  ORF Transcript_38104/g.93198 Transcript_38104/m.93198 type:complete len:399 (-) Transcript_38104:37-1233(-)
MRVAAVTVFAAAGEAGLMSAPLKALNEQLSMVEQSVKAAGKVTPGVYATVQKMKGMVEKVIEPAIVEAHGADQQLVYVTHKEVLACDTSYQSFVDNDIAEGWAVLNKTKTEWSGCEGDVEVLKQRFAKCLDDRDLLVQHNNTICCQEFAMCPSEGHCETVKLDQAHVGCDYKSKKPEECFAHAESLVASLEGYFIEQDARYEALRLQCAKFTSAVKAKVAECAYLQEAVNAKVSETNDWAERFNNGGEAFTQKCATRCADYKTCRKEKETQYLKITGPCESGDYAAGNGCVMNREQDRRNEWESTQLIKCMLQHYCEGGHFEEELLEKCKKQIKSCHLIIDYPKVPELIPCEIPTCEACPGCDECLDRPYYQYETPCYSNGPANGCVSVEKPECPGWC